MRRCHHMPVRAAHFASGRSDAIDLRGIGRAMVARREHDICGTPFTCATAVRESPTLSTSQLASS